MARKLPGAALPERLHIVVTCANRKRQPVPDRLRLGEVRDQRPGPRFATWTRRLSTTSAEAHPACDLYAGEHWQIARTLAGLAPHRPTTLWVCSAGYGLIPAEGAIRPYAATFAAGEPDSVGSARAGVQDWWARLTEWSGPLTHPPRSFADLAHHDPGATLVVVLSGAYQRACAKDVVAAACRLRSDRLSVVGPPGGCVELSDLLVPVTRALRGIVGGSLQSLNARTAAYLLRAAAAEGGDLRTSRLRELAAQATRSVPPSGEGQAAGRRLADDEVRLFISSRLADGPTSATPLLRLLRQSGQSCEQSRFRRLFADVARGKAGT